MIGWVKVCGTHHRLCTRCHPRRADTCRIRSWSAATRWPRSSHHGCTAAAETRRQRTRSQPGNPSIAPQPFRGTCLGRMRPGSARLIPQDMCSHRRTRCTASRPPRPGTCPRDTRCTAGCVLLRRRCPCCSWSSPWSPQSSRCPRGTRCTRPAPPALSHRRRCHPHTAAPRWTPPNSMNLV